MGSLRTKTHSSTSRGVLLPNVLLFAFARTFTKTITVRLPCVWIFSGRRHAAFFSLEQHGSAAVTPTPPPPAVTWGAGWISPAAQEVVEIRKGKHVPFCFLLVLVVDGSWPMPMMPNSNAAAWAGRGSPGSKACREVPTRVVQWFKL